MPTKVEIREGVSYVDRTSMVQEFGKLGGLSFSMSRGQRGTANIPLIIPAGTTYAPQEGWLVRISEINRNTLASQCVFIGVVQGVEIAWDGDFGYQEFLLQCVSLERILDSIQCSQVTYTNTDAGTILAGLFAQASPYFTVPLTLGTVDSGVSISERKYDPKTSIWSAMQQLGTDSAFIVYIDPRDTKLYFQAWDQRPAAFTIDGQPGQILWESIKWSRSEVDFANVQVIQLDSDTLPSDNSIFPGDGLQNIYTLPYPISQVTRAFLTISTQAQAIGTFSGPPLPGDTVGITPPYSPVIFPPNYEFVSALDNTVYGQVLIDPTAPQTWQNFVDAINGKPSTQGIKYSSPTWTNQQVTADDVVGSAFVLRAKMLGPTGNSIAISESASNFVWSTSILTGGVDDKSQELSVGPLLGGDFDLGYTPGSADVHLREQPAAGVSLSIDYIGPMSGFITLKNDQASGLGLPNTFNIARSKNIGTGADAIQQGGAELSAYSLLPAKFQFESLWPGLYCGGYVTVSISTPVKAGALLNGNWLVQSVQGSWTPGVEGLVEPYDHFRYTYMLINTREISTYQDTLQQLADTGPFKATTPIGSGIPQTPILPTDVLVPISRTLLIKDCTVGTNIADDVVLYTRDVSLSPVIRAVGRFQRIIGVLRKTISADLTVRFNRVTNSSPQTTESYLATIPAGTITKKAVQTNIVGFFNDLDTLYADIVASDGQAEDDQGIASFTIIWE